jgi:hypothetical protein
MSTLISIPLYVAVLNIQSLGLKYHFSIKDISEKSLIQGLSQLYIYEPENHGHIDDKNGSKDTEIGGRDRQISLSSRPVIVTMNNSQGHILSP